MVQDIWLGDLALLELLRGPTEAPAEVLTKLAVLGHVAIAAGGAPRLTTAGRERAEKLRDAEHDLRLLFAVRADGRAPLTTDGGTVLHVGGGKAQIRS
jgi:hypothetical protein